MKRPFVIENGTVSIPLTQGFTAVINELDLPKLAPFGAWQVFRVAKSNLLYAQTVKSINGKNVKFFLHRVITGANGFKIHVDHRDRDGLNNRQQNLRLCNSSQNGGNSKLMDGRKYKGTYLFKGGRKKPWVARITIGGRPKSLSYHFTEEEAALAYNAAAVQYFGEFARLNEVAA